MFLNGAEASGSEWTVHVSLPYAVPPARIPATAQYCALGHLHRAQDVAGAPVPARYSGSPLQLDFGDQQQRKSVTLVEAIAGRPARVEAIPLTAGRALRDVEGTMEELMARAAEFGDDYLRVFVNLVQPVSGLADQVRDFLPNAVQVRPKLPEGIASDPALRPEPGFTPEQQFAEWFCSQHTVPPPHTLIDAFRQLREEACHAAN
jgi:exonuclease SbcD